MFKKHVSLEKAWVPVLLLALAGALSMGAWGRGRSDAGRAPGSLRGPQGELRGGILPGLTLADLPSELNLTPAQQEQMQAALSHLRHGRRDLREEWGARRGPRDRARRGPHPGQRGRGHGPDWRRLGDHEPPMLGFLEETSRILTPDQFTTFARFLSTRRAEMRPRAGEMAADLVEHVPPFAARRLGLTAEQQERLHTTLGAHAEQARDLAQSLEAGTLTPEAAREKARTTRTELKAEVQKILTPEQWEKAQRFRQERITRRIDRRLATLEPNLGRRGEFIGRILDMSGDQKQQLKAILSTTVPERRSVLEGIRSGSVAPEDGAYQAWQIEKNAASRIRAILEPEQAQRFDALIQLLPEGARSGIPAGPGMRGGTRALRRGWKR